MNSNQKPPAGARINWGHPLTNGLVGAYECLELSGSALYDLVTNDKATFVSTAPFWQGSSVRFDGSANAYAQSTTGPNLASSPFSVVFLMANGAFNTAGGWLTVGTAGSTRQLIHIRGQNSTTLRFAMFSDDLDVTVPDMTNKTLHIVCTLDDQFTQKTYVNGVLIGSRTAGGFFTGNRTFSLGWGSSNTVLACNMFYARLYKRALAAAEVKSLYAQPYSILTSSSLRRVIPGFALDESIPPGSLTMAGIAPTIALTIAIGVGALTLTGLAPTTSQAGATIAVPAASATLTGFAPSVAISNLAAPGAGALALTGAAPTAKVTTAIRAIGIHSDTRIGTAAIFTAAQAEDELITIFENGVEISDKVKLGINGSVQVGSSGTATYKTFSRDGSYRPTRGAEIIVYKGTRRIFAGVNDTTDEMNYNSTTAIEVNVKAIDYGVLFDRKVIGKKYTLLDGSFGGQVVGNITTLVGNGLVYTGGFGNAIEPPLFNYRYATECIRAALQAANMDWYVDQWKTVYAFTKSSGRGAAPFTIADNDGNFRALRVIRSAVKKFNRIYVRNSQDFGALWTDSFTVSGSNEINFITTYILDQAPSVTVNGVAQTLVEIDEQDGSFDFYWIQGSYGVFHNQANAPLNPGDVIGISYPSPLSYVAIAEDAADIAANGLSERIEEIKDAQSKEEMQAIADGLLLRGVNVPTQIELETDEDGLEPGQVLTVNATRPLVSGTFLIESVAWTEIDKLFFRYTVRASDEQLQRTGSPVLFYQRMIEAARQPKDRIIERITFILAGTIEGLTNPGLTTGEKPAIRVAQKSGFCKSVTLRFKSVDDGTPTTSDIEVDIYQNGVSIFGTAGSPAAPDPLVFPAGQTGTVTRFSFRADPLVVAAGDVFTCEVLAADAVATDGTMELVIVG